MSSDLEKFLQMAAEKLREKMDQTPGGKPPAPNKKPRVEAKPKQVRKAERQTQYYEQDVIEPEIVEATVVNDSNDRRRGPNPLSNIDTRPALAQNIGLADERMSGHVHQALDHQLVNLPSASNALSSMSSSRPQTSEAQNAFALGSSIQLIRQLRDPNTLRSAFVASLIFERKCE